MNAKRSLLAGAFLSAALFAAPSQGWSQDVTLKLHTFLPPPANPVKTFLVPWSKKVEEASHGKLKVQVYTAMQLGGKPPELDDQVKKGIVDVGWTLPGYSPGAYPRVEVFELPFVSTNALSTTLALQDFEDKYLKEEFKDYKVLLLHCHDGSLLMTKGPVNKIEDMKGLKMRTATRVSTWYMQAVGATAVGAPITEVSQMLSKGVVDGTILPYEIAPAVKLQDLVHYFTTLSGNQPRMDTVVFSFLMNKRSYSKLSAENKKVIDSLSRRNIAKWAGQNWIDIEGPAQKVMASNPDNKFVTLSDEESKKFREAGKPNFDRWIDEMKKRKLDGAKMLADARAMVQKYTK